MGSMRFGPWWFEVMAKEYGTTIADKEFGKRHIRVGHRVGYQPVETQAEYDTGLEAIRREHAVMDLEDGLGGRHVWSERRKQSAATEDGGPIA